MKLCVFLFLLVHGVSGVKHSLQYFSTASSGIPNFPEFVVVAVADDVLLGFCDSNIRRVELKQDWMKKLSKFYPQHFEWYTHECLDSHQFFRANIADLKHRLNQTGDVHVLQRMTGCEWDDETEDVKGFNQYGYDGEDFIALDLKTLTWTAPKPQALATKLRWDADKDRLEYNKHQSTHVCREWLKKYTTYGRSFLQRTDVPSVSLLQKTPSSPVSCHATGFYPDRAMMFWRKDGEEIHEGVEHGEILPNHDGSFQMNVDLNISSVSPEDWRRYDCVFQLSGVEDDIITKLDKKDIRSNGGKPTDMTTIIIIVVTACGVLAVILIAAIAVKLYKKKNAKPQPDMKTSPDAPTGGVKTEGSQSSSTSDGFSVGSECTDTPLIRDSLSSSDLSSTESVQSNTPLIKDNQKRNQQHPTLSGIFSPRH